MRARLLLFLCLFAGSFHAAFAAATYSLTVVAGAGVTGSPGISTHAYAAGASVSYHYVPKAGFAAAVVVLDGQIVPAAATITMNANHWMYAYGNPSTGTLFGNTISVPSDPTLVLYPQHFQNRAVSTVRVVDPYCATTADTISYPASYLGAFPLPAVVGAPLAPAVKRGGQVKDYWQYGMRDPSTNAGCGGNLHTAFIETLKRLKKEGFDHVGISRDSEIIDTNANPIRIRAYAQWSISPAELNWIVQQATALGLKVYDYRQVTMVDSLGNTVSTAPTMQWATRFFNTYVGWIVARAREAQTAGVDTFMLDPGGMFFTNMPPGSDLETLLRAKFTEAAQKVRAVFSGKIMYGTMAPWNSGDANLMAAIDYLIVPIWMINTTTTENAHLTVAMMKQKYINLIGALADTYGPARKPAIFQVYAQSTRDWYLTGWIEDGFCTPKGANPCQEKNVKIDFSVQAIAYEAMLEAIRAQPSFQTYAVDATASWYVDVILGKDAFPNLSQSWRNKPAEAILRKWFR